MRLSLRSLILSWILLFSAFNHAADPQKPVPAADVVTTAEKEVKDLFKAEYAARTPDARSKSAAEFLAKGITTTDNDAARYILLRDACEFAAQAGDVALLGKAIQTLVGAFAADRIVVRMKLLAVVPATTLTPDVSKLLVEEYIALLGDAIAADRYAEVAPVLPLIERAARQSKDVALASMVQSRSQSFKDLQAEFTKAKTDKQTLETNPKDEKAALGYGRYLAFAKGDWDAGLPLIALAKDAPYAQAVGLDLEKPSDAGKLAAAADAWWDAAAKESVKSFRLAIQKRAVANYKKSLAGLGGLSRTRAEKRIDEIEPTHTGSLYASCDASVEVVFNDKVIGKSSQHGALTPIPLTLKRGDTVYFLSKAGGAGRSPGVSWLFVNPDEKWFISSSKENTLGAIGKYEKATVFEACGQSKEWVYNSLFKRLPEDVKGFIKKPEGLEAPLKPGTGGLASYRWIFSPSEKEQ